LSTELYFDVLGEPIGQPRHRVSTIGGRARTYLPKSHPVHGYKAAIRAAFTAKAGKWETITGPVHLAVYLQFEMPKSWSRKKREELIEQKHVGKPDLDNVLKAVCDALTDCGAWQDDRQVASIFIAKRWSERGKTTIRIERETEGAEYDWTTPGHYVV